MKALFKILFFIAILGSQLTSCKPDLAIPSASKGNLNLTSYVAIGNSLTAGYQNNGLYYEGQKSSYANLLAEQFKKVQADLVFKTPLVSSSSVGCAAPNVSFSPSPDLNDFFGLLTQTFTIDITVPAPYSIQSKLNCKGEYSLTPAPLADYGDGTIMFGPSFDNANGLHLSTGILNINIPTAPSIYSAEGPFQNMGVPGARAIDINRQGFGGSNLISIDIATAGFNQSNPFFSRFAKDQASSSILSDAMLMNPTFFSLFVGNNDVLLWASQGGASTFGSSPLTPVQEFADSMEVIVSTLMTSAKQGIILNIPQITGAAFFNYLPANTDYQIIDETGATRNMYADEMILLTCPQDSLNCLGFGTTIPIPKKYTLTRTQIAQANSSIDAYNVKLKALADANDLAYFDMNGFTTVNQIGLKYNSMDINTTFVTGGLFSLDGLHLTPRGYAAVTNELIKVINQKYEASIPGLDLTKIYGVNFSE